MSNQVVGTFKERFISIQRKLKRWFLKFIWANKVDFSLILILLGLSVVSYRIRPYFSTDFAGWLTNISAGLFSSIFIIFGIDTIRIFRIEAKKNRGKKVAKRDLHRSANMCVSYVLYKCGVLTHAINNLSSDIDDIIN